MKKHILEFENNSLKERIEELERKNDFGIEL